MQALLEHIKRYIPLSEADERKIASTFKVRTLKKNELLIQKDNVCLYEHYVRKGILRSFYVDEQGDEHTLHFAAEDWWITDLESFIHQSPSLIYAEALEAAEVLQITKQELSRLYEEVPLLDRFFRMLHERAYIAQNRRILNAIRFDGLNRYLDFVHAYPLFHQRIPQKFIASYLGMTPVFLSQIRKKLSRGD